MADYQQSMPFGTTEPGDDVLRLELTITTDTDINPGKVYSVYTAFNNAFGATPDVIGWNIKSGATTGVAAIRPTATGVTIYIQGVTENDLAVSGSVVVQATVRGALA